MNHFIYRQSLGTKSFFIIDDSNQIIGSIYFGLINNKYGWRPETIYIFLIEEQMEEITNKLKFLNKNKNLSYPEQIELLNKD